jgi:hypothetical protein
MMRVRGLLVLVANVGLLALAPGQARAVAVEGEGALAWRLQRIETAVRAADAGGLRGSFAGSGKVRADLRDFTNGLVWYGPGQLQVIFGQIFEEFETRDFAFRKGDVTLSSPSTAFARGRWVRRSRRGGPDVVDTLTVTLHADRGDWRILEIRSSR